MFVRWKCMPFPGKNFGSAWSGLRWLRIEPSSLFRWNSKITSLFKKRDVRSARRLFDEMPHKNVVTWNCVISGYIKNGMIREAREVFDSMPFKNVVSWTAMLSGYAKSGMLEEARRLFDLVERKNVACWNSMISGYINNGRIEEARELFDGMPLKNDVSWAMMIEGYFKYGAVSDAETLFDEASSRSLLLCNSMLTGYCQTREADKSYDLFMRMCDRDTASWTCMIKCFMGVGEVERARRLFEELPKKDTVAWTVMINGYLDHGKFELARELFDKMPQKDIISWNTMLRGCVHCGNAKDALDLFVRMPERNMVSWNLMLLGYLQQGDMASANKFFEEMPNKDKTSWNTLISGYQSEVALVLYVQMLLNGFKPDQGTLTSVISVCGVLAIQSWGKAMHVFAIKIGYENDSMVMNSLISMYSKCGFIKDASQIFKTMQKRDTAAWNTMIVSHAYHHSAKDSLGLFHSMIQDGCQPNHVTFLVLLTACAHSGLVNDGWKYLKLMKRWDLIPKPEHLASVIDLLGRSGLLAEAFELVNYLPSNHPVYAWESLLSACSIHGSYEINDLVAKKIFGEPVDVGMSVLQSNIYAARGMWKDAAQIRAKLKRNQLNKEVGCSWIDISGRISCFSYNDKSHIRRKEIYEELERLSLLTDEVEMH